MSVIEVVGLASGTPRFINYSDSDLPLDLLTFLRSRQVTIASSCSGEGVCKKCVIQHDWLTCMMTLKEFLQRQPDKKIFVSYL